MEIINKMAKAVLHFDLKDQDDLRSFKIASRAEDMHNVLWQIHANMFNAMEGIAESNVDGYTMLQKIREYISDELEKNDLFNILDV